jgi:hypothetical protein
MWAIVNAASFALKRAPFHFSGSDRAMADTKTQRRKAGAPTPKGGEGKKCSIESCKRAYQAKGYCFFHYDKWKGGDLPKARYKTCSREGCLKKVFAHGVCAEHQLKKLVDVAPAAPAPAAPAA